jgi:polar amino acid transport system substrate-binding protein
MVKKIIPFFCLVLMVLWLPGSSVSGEIHRVLFADTPFPPYIVGELGQHPTGGISVELLQELFDRLGVEVSVELHPWKRTLKLAEFGKVDGIPLLMRNSERDRFLVFTEVLFESRELFHYRKDRFGGFSWQGYTDLKNYTIGLVSGYTYGPEFLQAVEELNLKVKYADSSLQNLHEVRRFIPPESSYALCGSRGYLLGGRNGGKVHDQRKQELEGFHDGSPKTGECLSLLHGRFKKI